MAMLLLGFSHVIVDKKGQIAAEPTPNWNDTALCRPTQEIVMKYQKRDIRL